MLEAEQHEPPKVTMWALTIQDTVPCANPKSRSIAGRATVTTVTSMPSGTVGTRQSFTGPFRSAAGSYPDHFPFSGHETALSRALRCPVGGLRFG